LNEVLDLAMASEFRVDDFIGVSTEARGCLYPKEEIREALEWRGFERGLVDDGNSGFHGHAGGCKPRIKSYLSRNVLDLNALRAELLEESGFVPHPVLLEDFQFLVLLHSLKRCVEVMEG
jgi:hypothetical protein